MRLDHRFDKVQRLFEERKMRLREESHDLIPEEVVVLELRGSVEDFARVVEKVEGLEWLSELGRSEVDPDEDFREVDEEGTELEKELSSRLFVVSSNQDGLRRLLSLWAQWKRGERFRRGLGKWPHVFERLFDVRRWGVEDRLRETGVLEDWQARLSHGADRVPCEIELWFRRGPEQRQRAQQRTEDLVRRSGGRVHGSAVIEEIGYHAALAELPAGMVQAVHDKAGRDIELIQCEHIQFFRASGQMVALPPETGAEQPESGPVAGRGGPPPQEDAVVAVLDGLPLQGHDLLKDRLRVDDPDGWERNYPASDRLHGTAMASLIVHGDLDAAEPPLRRKLYVRPIMRPVSRGWVGGEAVPDDVLVVDLIQRAVRRLFDGEGAEPPAAPTVRVVNLSIGIRDRPFDQALSPLARLLDWLARKYLVLFVVSAGNHFTGLSLPKCTGDLGNVPAGALQHDLIRAVAEDARSRRLLSPAEAINALTVAATHEDRSGAFLPPRYRDPYKDSGLPSPINAVGAGFRRAVKPEVLAAGGRVPVKEADATLGAGSIEVEPYRGVLAPGLSVAAPGVPGATSGTTRGRGTSNGAALTSRAAASLDDVLEDLRTGPDGQMIDGVPRAVWIKALLAHGASWGDAGATIGSTFRDESARRRKQRVTDLLGYGAFDIERVKACTERRVTVVGGATVREDEKRTHRIPVPAALRGTLCARRLVVTLAWISPINPKDQRWRRAHVYFSVPDENDNHFLHVKRTDYDRNAVRRGTLQHEVSTASKPVTWVGDRDLDIEVSCRADAGSLEEEVPYALVVTLEVGEGLFAANLYDEVHARLQAARPRVPIQPTGP
ncbi:MAG: S8 family peptidase [Rhodospirillales bacterium]|nr:S8 family peptidase [Rhodospirillales bacterium]